MVKIVKPARFGGFLRLRGETVTNWWQGVLAERRRRQRERLETLFEQRDKRREAQLNREGGAGRKPRAALSADALGLEPMAEEEMQARLRDYFARKGQVE